MPQEGPLRQCVLTISTMSQQGASEEMHKSFLIASHCLYSISQFHRYRYMYKILNLTYSSENIGLPTWSPHYTGYLYQAVSFAGSCMPSAGPGASFAYNRFYRALFQLFKVQPGASKPLFPPWAWHAIDGVPIIVPSLPSTCSMLTTATSYR